MSRAAGGLAVFAALLPVVAVPTAGAAVPIPSPATVLSVSPFDKTLSNELQGAVCQSPNTCTPVLYPPFVTPSGVTALQTALTTTSASKIIVFGYSNGAEVAEQWLTQHLNDPNAPSPEVLSFVVIGNPTRAFGGHFVSRGEVWPQSPYRVIDIARQYDGPADYPDNTASPYYPLAVINAHLGFLTIHINYHHVNINDPANAVWTSADGNITYVLTPTQNLPILGVFAPLFPSLNAQLKAQIETAYIRPVPFPTTTQPASPATSPAAGTALSTSVVSDPRVAPQHTMVPVNLAPAPTAATTGAAPTATGPNTTNSTDTDLSAADTLPTTSPADRADVVGTVTTITPPAKQPGRHNPIMRPRDPAPHLTTRTHTDGNKVAPGKPRETRVRPGRESRGPLTGDDGSAAKESVRGNDRSAGA